MADPKNPNLTTLTLPPGCRFYPSEHQLFSHYLTHKNTHDHHDNPLNFNDVIREIDLYNYDPFDLPDIACFSYGYRGRRRHWYCFTAALAAEGREKRSASGGYWRRKGRVRDLGIGTRTSFVFWLGNSGKSDLRKTDWVMYEYALADHLKAFVLCRIFAKTRRENTLSDHVISSCAEESVAAVRHIGIQHDETVSSDVALAKTSDAKSVGREDIFEFPMRVFQELNDLVTQGTVSVSKFEVPSESHPTELVKQPRITSGSAVFIDDVSTHHLASILEGDFIELDDLFFPLLGTDDIG